VLASTLRDTLADAVLLALTIALAELLGDRVPTDERDVLPVVLPVSIVVADTDTVTDETVLTVALIREDADAAVVRVDVTLLLFTAVAVLDAVIAATLGELGAV